MPAPAQEPPLPSSATPRDLVDVANGTAGRARRQRGVGTEGGRHDALAGSRMPRPIAFFRHEPPAFGELGVAHGDTNGAVRDVDLDPVALLDESDRAAFRRLGRGMAYRETRSAAGEAPVGDERAQLA